MSLNFELLEAWINEILIYIHVYNNQQDKFFFKKSSTLIIACKYII